MVERPKKPVIVAVEFLGAFAVINIWQAQATAGSRFVVDILGETISVSSLTMKETYQIMLTFNLNTP